MNEFLKDLLPESWNLITDELFAFETPEGPVVWKTGKTQQIYTSDIFELSVSIDIDKKYRSLVYTQTIKNISSETAVLSRIEPLHLHWEPNDGPVYIRTCGGGLNQHNYPPETFRIETVRADSHASVWMENSHEGRSSGNNLPLMTICCGDNSVTAGLEWSGLWWMQGSGKADWECRLFCHIPVNDLVLEPGEELELPAAHYIFSDGGLDGASNAIRKYIHDCVVPKLNGDKLKPGFTYNHWFGIGPDINEELMVRQFEKAGELGLEYAVLDAGWYGDCEEGNFQTGVGNWEVVDTDKFPNGLEPLAECAEKNNVKFGIWFEVERAHKNSKWAKEHPDWFMDAGSEYLHIDMSIPEAVDACIDVVQKTIGRLNIKWVKLDYNIGPKSYWAKKDSTGKIQFSYMKGLYRFYDTLREKNPDLVIENCASGGRRIDLGTIAHTHIQNLTDQTGSPEICRYTIIGANYFLPACIAPIGLPFGKKETDQSDPGEPLRRYDIACRFPGCPVLYGDIASLTGEDVILIKDMMKAHKECEDMLCGDFYQLTPQPRFDRDCEAIQFISRDRSEALVLAYSGHEPADREMELIAKNLNPHGVYAVSGMFGSSLKKSHGAGIRLMDEGFTLALEPRSFAGIKFDLREEV